MIFVKERLEVIAAQLKKFRIPQSFQLDSWKVKEGFWLRPEEVDADPAPFTDFDSKLMHWYGPDRHYWFRTGFTVPESYDGKELWLYLRTQIEEWDDAKNPQFLIFVNGELKQGADMNHRSCCCPAVPKPETSTPLICRPIPAFSIRSSGCWQMCRS